MQHMEGLGSDPWIEAQIDAAVAPYAAKLPAEEIAWMRDRLAEALATERRGQELLRRARPRAVERSGAVSTGPAAQEERPAARRGRAG